MDAALRMEKLRDSLRKISTESTLSHRAKALLSVAVQMLDDVASMPHSIPDKIKRPLQLQALERTLHLVDCTTAIVPKKHSIQTPLSSVLTDAFFLESALTGATENAER